MRAVLHGGWVDYVIYMGITENYPDWFNKEVLNDIYMDESRFTMWQPEEERSWDYYEKDCIESDSVFLRKPNGEIFMTSKYVFDQLYVIFLYDGFSNYGVAAYRDDCIEYVECQPGVVSADHPDWFYEYFTEAVHFQDQKESIFIFDRSSPVVIGSSSNGVISLTGDVGQISVDSHCVFLRNFLGEIKHMEYSDFLKHYHPGPIGGFSYGS